MTGNLEEVRDDVRAELIEEGYAEADAGAAVSRSTEPLFFKMYGEALGWLKERKNGSGQHSALSTQPKNNSSSQHLALSTQPKTTSQPSKEKPVTKSATETHICPGYERACTNEIGPRKSLCGACYARKNYRENHPKAKPRAAAKLAARSSQPKAAKPKSNGHQAARENLTPDTLAPDTSDLKPASRTLPLQVSEEVVNRFLTGLPFEDKVALAQQWLRGEQDVGFVTHTLPAAGRLGKSA